jgi:IS30 family transposase
MADLDLSKNKHMNLDSRTEVQQCLDHGMAFKAIAKRIGKDQTTVSKEVKKHICFAPSDVTHLNQDGTIQENVVCPSLLKAPFVCNPCKKRHRACGFKKQFYNAKKAQGEYESLLSESREGIPLNKEAFYEIDAVVTKGIKQGQHLYHIMKANDLGVSKSTIYRHLHRGYLSAAAIDFPRVVKFKKRCKRHEQYVPKSAKIGRTYEDFLRFTEETGISSWVEMDTVIGAIGGKTILTLHFTFCNFMLGLLLDNKTSAEAAGKITLLKERLAEASIRFGDLFPLILTDNGGEFSNVWAIENNANKEQETRLFFCDPYKSSQKPRVEKNHTIFRDIVPKGSSFDAFTQDTVNLIFSHVNGVKRNSLNGKSPYDVFEFTYGAKTASLLGIERVPALQVIQSPKLLKQ